MSVAGKLKSARRRAGLTQAQAAGLCGVPVRTLQGWERGLGARSIGPRDALAVLQRADAMARVVAVPDGPTVHGSDTSTA